MSETNIILAVIGCVGLIATLAVYSRANNANTRFERRLLQQRRAVDVSLRDERCDEVPGRTLAINDQQN